MRSKGLGLCLPTRATSKDEDILSTVPLSYGCRTPAGGGGSGGIKLPVVADS